MWAWMRDMQDDIRNGVEQYMILGKKPELRRTTEVLTDRDVLLDQVEQDENKFTKAEPEAAEIVTELANWHNLRTMGRNQTARQYVRIYAASAHAAFQIARIDTPWNVVNQHAVDWALVNSATQITEIIEETQAGLRGIISRGIADGETIPEIGRRMRGLKTSKNSPSLGLNARQSAALDKYRNKLKAQYSELPGGLNSKRRARLDRRVQREAEKKLRYRVDMIARTETAEAVSEGTLKGYQLAGVPTTEFMAAADACIICIGYDGNTYTVAEAGGIIPVHPNCRCTWKPVVDIPT